MSKSTRSCPNIKSLLVDALNGRPARATAGIAASLAEYLYGTGGLSTHAALARVVADAPEELAHKMLDVAVGYMEKALTGLPDEM